MLYILIEVEGLKDVQASFFWRATLINLFRAVRDQCKNILAVFVCESNCFED